MPQNLATNFTIQNGTRLKFVFHDDREANVMTVTVSLYQASATDGLISRVVLIIRDGTSDTITRQLTPAVGLDVADYNRYFVKTTRSTPTGYTDMKTDERAAANTHNARQNALEASMLSRGHMDSSLG